MRGIKEQVFSFAISIKCNADKFIKLYVAFDDVLV